jgi:hypothetical protein
MWSVTTPGEDSKEQLSSDGLDEIKMTDELKNVASQNNPLMMMEFDEPVCMETKNSELNLVTMNTDMDTSRHMSPDVCK